METYTGVRPGGTFAVAAVSSGGMGLGAVAALVVVAVTNPRVPTQIALPPIVAVAPLPGSWRKESSSTTSPAPPAAANAAVTASASGCREFFSTAAAMANTSASLTPSATTTRFTTGRPTVSVPVLSNTTVSNVCVRSSTSPPRISSPCLAPSDVPTSTAVGVASPSAHGHATTRTDAAIWSPSRSGALPAAAAVESTEGNILVPTVDQNANVAALAPMTPYTNLPLTASARRCTGASRCCAASTIRTMPATCVSSPELTTCTVRAPSQLMVPALTPSPAFFRRGIGSPLIAASSTWLAPLTTTPSTGMRSPGKTKIRSSRWITDVGTVR
mmetsp:Transcript_17956/g.44499  ORF Transcript_17956/g.44499 Transcript_17956/m.44499 type:complete len:330 (-) Transcript_17956:858-1847(-)